MGWFAKLDLNLSRIPPLYFLGLYLVAIPCFGGAYTFIAPHGFYAPYADHEPALQSDSNALALTIRQALQRGLDAQSDGELVVGPWTLDRKSVWVSDVQSADGATIAFRAHYKASAGGLNAGETGREIEGYFQVSIDGKPDHVPAPGDHPLVFLRSVRGDFWKANLPEAALALIVFNRNHAPSSGYFSMIGPNIALTETENRRLIQFLIGKQGDPSGVSGQYSRMVYLSAVVITTLGLGDIVPVTPEARLLVATEAILGIGLAGLFLNALAYRASSGRS